MACSSSSNAIGVLEFLGPHLAEPGRSAQYGMASTEKSQRISKSRKRTELELV